MSLLDYLKKIEANAKGGKIEFNDKPNIDPMVIIKLIQTHTSEFRLEGPSRLRFILPEHDIINRLSLIEKIFEKLSPG